MNICLVGDFSAPDEARKVMAYHMLRLMSREHDVEVFDLTNLFSAGAWKKIKQFAPDILHYIPGASTFSFMFTRVLHTYVGGQAKTVIFSALNTLPGAHGFTYGPYYALSWLSRGIIPLTKTDLVLVQSDHAEKTYQDLGCDVKYLVYSGVDLERFHNVSASEKQDLKIEHGVEPDKYTILHVGSVRKWRNVDLLIEIQREPDNQVVLIGRADTKNEKDVERILRKYGVIVTEGYTPHIERFYGLADCYVFPTNTEVGSIDVPLSVLEAMAFNLPIVSTRFGGLPRMFDETDGFFYADAANFNQKIQAAKDENVTINTRKLVTPYSWDNIVDNLYEVYDTLLG